MKLKILWKFIDWCCRNSESVIHITAAISMAGGILISGIDNKSVRIPLSVLWLICTYSMAGFAAYADAYKDRGEQ